MQACVDCKYHKYSQYLDGYLDVCKNTKLWNKINTDPVSGRTNYQTLCDALRFTRPENCEGFEKKQRRFLWWRW